MLIIVPPTHSPRIQLIRLIQQTQSTSCPDHDPLYLSHYSKALGTHWGYGESWSLKKYSKPAAANSVQVPTPLLFESLPREVLNGTNAQQKVNAHWRIAQVLSSHILNDLEFGAKMGKGGKHSSELSVWCGFGSEPKQPNLRAYVCALCRERGVHKGWGSQARGIYLDELICFLLSSSPPHLLFLFLPVSPGGWLTPALPWSYHFPSEAHSHSDVTQAVLCEIPASLTSAHRCARFKHTETSAVVESLPISKQSLLKSSCPPMTRWCLDGIWELQLAGNSS